VLVLGCAGVKQPHAGMGQAGSAAGATGAAGSSAGTTDAAAGADGADAAAGTSGAAGTVMLPPACTSACTDFPAAPLLDTGVAINAPSLFIGAPTGAGPCITEPEDGALFPNNWLRPRVKFTPTTPGTLYEIRVHADKEANDLVAYTTSTSWTLPRPVWLGLTVNVRDVPITVTVRALGGGASTVKFTIAPVKALGSVVFWAADPTQVNNPKPDPRTSSLQGFAVGDEATTQVLGVLDVQMKTRGQNNALRPVTCIGCHNSTPDGESVGFLDNYPWSMAMAGVAPGRTGLPVTYVTPGGTDVIRQPGMGIFSFSKAHWAPGDRIIVSPYYLDMPCGNYDQGKSNVQLAWLDVEATPVTNGCPVEGTQFGIIARTGDTKGAANPTWSHDGKTIVYSSTTGNQDGRLSTGPTDLYQVPYNNKAGGAATPLPGASDPAFEEYYPAFSPDDKLVVFDRVPAGGSMYANDMAELAVVPVSTDPAQKSQRLDANDPPKCSGKVSPGVNNHWAKWSPDVQSDGGRTYYWLIFSSNRYGTPPVTASGTTVEVSQLYATAIVVSETSLQMYPAIYLWNQKPDTLNTTPAWDPFKIPVVQ
jgi:WD40-like Beta Propeller Repeat